MENCMCTLHNLTYQLWQECPEASFSTEAQSEGRKSPTVGCFSPRSRKAKDEVGVNQEAWPNHDDHILGPKLLSSLLRFSQTHRKSWQKTAIRKPWHQRWSGCTIQKPQMCMFHCSSRPKTMPLRRPAVVPCRTSLRAKKRLVVGNVKN